MLTKYVLVIVLIACVSMSDAQLVVGSKCTISNVTASGECKLLRNCQKAIGNILKNSTVEICGFSELEPIVCCEIPTTTTANPFFKRIEKCNEYGKSVYEEKGIISLIHTDEPPRNVKVDTCVINSPFLIGGSHARSRELPHYALLGYNSSDTGNIEWNCGGTLISSRFILTAAHCLHSRNLGPVHVIRLGDIATNQYLTDILVQQTIQHPDFTPTKMYNDIGLIKMAKKVEFSKFIRPICLPTSDQVPTKLFEVGWEFQSISENQNGLFKEIVHTKPNEECNTYFQPFRKLREGIIDKQLCISFTERSSFCKGDIVQIYNPDTYCMYTQIGVSSFGSSCNLTPTIYTNVFKYSDWIEEIIWGPGEDE